VASTIQRAVTVCSSVLSLSPSVRDLVQLVAQLHVPDARATDEVDPGGQRLLAEEVLEAAAVELVGVDGEPARGPALDALRQLGVVAGREPEAQAVLRDLLVHQVVREPELMPEVLAGDLLGRLADLEGRLAGGALPFLGDEDAGPWPRLHDLVREVNPASHRRGSRRRSFGHCHGALLSLGGGRGRGDLNL
jgi:hypothetical protein